MAEEVKNSVPAPEPEQGVKKSNRDRLKEITDSIESGIREVFSSDRYAAYLQTMGRFHRYSFRNTMLIHLQRPDATLVAGFNKWRDDFNRRVKKGEKGIKIIAPAAYKRKEEKVKLDPDTNAPLLDENGKAIVEEKEVSIPYFHVVTVFDVSQTEGKPLPELAAPIKGNVKQYEIFMEALRRAAPVPVQFEELPPDTDGVFRGKQQQIVVRKGMGQAQTMAALIHEITHAKLHNAVFPAKDDPKKYRRALICSKQALFSRERLDRANLPGGLFLYELRGSQDKPGVPASVENKVVNNFAGSIVTAAPIELSKSGFRALPESGGLTLLDGSATLTEFYLTYKKDRATQEVEAESVAYAVCQYYGIETSENSFGYIASWSKSKELNELRDSLTTINAVSSSLIADVDRHFREICKERGVEPKAIEAASADEPEEALFQLGDGPYLHILSSEGGYDYSLYASEDGKEYGGGRLDNGGLSIYEACAEVCQMHGLDRESVKVCPLEKLEELTAANEPIPAVKLDSYPMPDPLLGLSDLESAGYAEKDMLPVNRDRALELLENDMTVYAIADGGQPELMVDKEDIDGFPPEHIFAVDLYEWQASTEFTNAVFGRLDRQEQREADFDACPENCFAVYQVKNDPAISRNLAFMSLAYMENKGYPVSRENYDLVYTAAMPEPLTPEDLFQKCNADVPADFSGHSLSVSDVVAIKRDGHVSYYYCDSIGFKGLPDFRQPESHTEKTAPSVAELEGQVKAGQSISLMDLAVAAHGEDQGKKPSVLSQLKNKPAPSKIQTAPKKSAEKGR